MTNLIPKILVTGVAIIALYNFGSFVLYMQTPEGQCENAAEKAARYELCYSDSSCMLDRHELRELDKYRKTQAIYCPIAEGNK